MAWHVQSFGDWWLTRGCCALPEVASCFPGPLALSSACALGVGVLASCCLQLPHLQALPVPPEDLGVSAGSISEGPGWSWKLPLLLSPVADAGMVPRFCDKARGHCGAALAGSVTELPGKLLGPSGPFPVTL